MDALRKALFRALEKSDINMLRAVLAQGAPVAHEAGDPDPVAFVAAQWDNDLDMFETLHAAGVDLTVRESEYQDTLLHWCVGQSDEAVLPWLLAQGLDVNARNSKGRRPLVFACEGVSPEHDEDSHTKCMHDVHRLIEAGADVNAVDEDGGTVLQYASASGAHDLVTYLLSCGADPTRADIHGQTPLHRVARLDPADTVADHLLIVDRMVTAGADIEALNSLDHSPLTTAVHHGNAALTRKLIDLGADVHTRGELPVRLAMSKDGDNVLEILIRAGARLDTPEPEENQRPLSLAAHNGYLLGAQTLLDHGVDIEATNIDGETALLIAVHEENYDIVELLLARGANRHHADHYNNTALSWATRRKDARLIEILTS